MKKSCIVLLIVIFSVAESVAHAQSLLCVARSAPVRNGKVTTSRLLRVVTTSSCPSGYTQLLSTNSFTGPTGATGATGASGAAGANGADGQLRIYGNGSVGALNVTSLFSTLSNGNLQYTSCTIQAGASLTVPSGTILRCSGDVVIDGLISVDTAASGGLVGSVGTANVYTSMSRSANPGRIRAVATNGEMGGSGQILTGGLFSFAMGNEESFIAYQPHLFGGAGGGGSAGQGGAGGGGGGGLVYVISPSNSVDTTGINNLGGTAGDASTQVSSSIAISGGGGGASVGTGGSGGSIGSGRPISASSASNGSDGVSRTLTADPTALS